MTAPATIVVDTGGLEALVAEVAPEEFYGFDTEFHTERTYVPDLALIQLAWADKVALVDPLAVDPAPLAGVSAGPASPWPTRPHRTSTCSGGVRRGPRHRLRHPDRRRFLGMSTPSLSRLVDQMLGVSLPKADRLSDWLAGRSRNARSPTPSTTSPTYWSCGPCSPSGSGLGAPGVGPERMRPGAGRPHPGPRPRRGVVEAR